MVVMSSPFSRLTIVVFPALSRPLCLILTIQMQWNSFKCKKVIRASFHLLF